MFNEMIGFAAEASNQSANMTTLVGFAAEASEQSDTLVVVTETASDNLEVGASLARGANEGISTAAKVAIAVPVIAGGAWLIGKAMDRKAVEKANHDASLARERAEKAEAETSKIKREFHKQKLWNS